MLRTTFRPLLIKTLAIIIGAVLLFRLLSISEGIPISVITHPTPGIEALEKVIRHNPRHAYAHEQLAWQKYQKGHYNDAKQHALMALQNNLSSGIATAVLMAAYDHEKKPEQSHQAAQLSAHLWPAHDLSMKMIADHWLKAGYLNKAMSAWNVSLSQDPHKEFFAEGATAKAIFPILNKVAQHEESTQLFQPYHLHPPSWWDEFFKYMVVQPNNLLAVDRFYQQTLLNGKISNKNKKLYLSNLIQENEWPRAHDVWQKGLPKEKQPYASLIYDGSFESNQINNQYTDEQFSWTIANKNHIQAYLDRFSKAGGAYSLRVAFNNWISDYWGYIRQVLVLKPGSYQLTYKTRANLKAEEGVLWIIYCMKDKKSEASINTLGKGQRLSGFFDWKKDQINFTVPNDPSCKAQKLTLVLAGNNASKQRVRGDIWFDDFVILPKN